jgi:hypothetical protein
MNITTALDERIEDLKKQAMNGDFEHILFWKDSYYRTIYREDKLL